MRWYLDVQGERLGPLDDAAVVRMIQSGQLQTAWICQEGGEQWVALGAHPPFAQALAGASAPAADQVPVVGAAPAADQVPIVGAAPAADQVPVVGAAPAANQLPVVGAAPAAGQAPVVGATPAAAAPGVSAAPDAPAVAAPPVTGDEKSDSLGGLLGRVPKLFTSPTGYWESFQGVSGSVGSLLTPNVLILAGATAVFGLLGSLIALRKLLGMDPASIMIGLVIGLVAQVVASVGVWLLMGILINTFAGTFGAQKSGDQARKLAFGALLPMWLAGIFKLIPISWLGLLFSLLALGYGCYLLYVGLPQLNGTPKDKAVGYTATVMALTFVIAITLGILAACPIGCATGCAMKSAYYNRPVKARAIRLPERKTPKSSGGNKYRRKYRIIAACMKMCRKRFGGESSKQRACNIICRRKLYKKFGISE